MITIIPLLSHYTTIKSHYYPTIISLSCHYYHPTSMPLLIPLGGPPLLVPPQRPSSWISPRGGHTLVSWAVDHLAGQRWAGRDGKVMGRAKESRKMMGKSGLKMGFRADLNDSQVGEHNSHFTMVYGTCNYIKLVGFIFTNKHSVLGPHIVTKLGLN